jgi:nitrous oxide reductase accessory protein NosL
MKKILFILACVSICAFSCKQKATQPENQVQQEATDMELCQSCGMPLTAEFYGTDADGSLNSEYCKYCYADGQFVAPDLTMERMIEICVPYMMERGMSEEYARHLLLEYMPQLKRWQTQEE